MRRARSCQLSRHPCRTAVALQLRNVHCPGRWLWRPQSAQIGLLRVAGLGGDRSLLNRAVEDLLDGGETPAAARPAAQAGVHLSDTKGLGGRRLGDLAITQHIAGTNDHGAPSYLLPPRTR